MPAPPISTNTISAAAASLQIVGWSLAAAASIVLVVLFGVPLAADRLAPLVPPAFEARLGDVAEKQVKLDVRRARSATTPPGRRAFVKLVNAVRSAAGLDTSVQSAVLSSEVPNAFALPGGKVFVFDALLAKAKNPDEIAGVIAHELGHLKHRDNMKGLIYNGGTSFLIGLLFGDITGSSALIFASRTLVTASYSREAETARRHLLDCGHAAARPAAKGDGRTDAARHRQGRRQGPVDHLEPSAERRPARPDEQGGSVNERPAVADAMRNGRR